MKSRRSSLISFILLSLLPLLLGSSNLPLNENENFYISNYTTFSPGSSVKINLYYYGSGGKFNFRLLRINDPEEFFAKQDFSTIRYGFDIWGKEKDLLLTYTSVFKEWKESYFRKDKYYGNHEIKVGKINEPGIYILQAIKGEQVAYCGVVVSDLAMVYKTSGKQILAYVANYKTGEFITDAKYTLYAQNKLLQTQKSDKDGIVLFDINSSEKLSDNSSLILAKTEDEIVLSNPYFYFRGQGYRDYSVYVYTNQPVYRPGQEVFFKSIIREKLDNELKNVSDEKFIVEIKSPKNSEVFSEELTSNEFGTLSGSFMLDDEADLGDYSINITKGEAVYYGSFSVEEYKKPEYLVEVSTSKNQYAAGDLVRGKVKADYYFGSPVTTGKVNLKIFRKNYWRPWWYWSNYAWFYRGIYKDVIWNRTSPQLIKQIEGELNSSGEFEFEYEAQEDLEQDLVYTFTAEVTDNSRRTISGSSDAYITRGNFTITTSPENYFVIKNKPVNIKVNASDFSENPVEVSFEVEIKYPGKNYNTYADRSEKLSGKTDKKGRSVVTFNRNDVQGHYQYIVTAYDDKGRKITAANSFYVGDIENYYSSRTGYGLEIVTDKESYEKGDSLIAYIFSPKDDIDLLLTYEANSIFYYKKYHIKNNSFVIREKLDDKFSPSFNITLSFLNDGQFYTTSKLVGVIAKDKFLNISIKHDKDFYKPGESSDYLVSIKDYKGNPVKNGEFSLGIIDESIYSIKNETAEDIQNFFYSPAYSYISTVSSLNQNALNGSSRPVTFLDKFFFNGKINFDKKGKGNLKGKVMIEDSKDPASGLRLMLASKTSYYTTITDSSGKYNFKTIPEGEYDLLVFYSGGKIVLESNIKIEKNSEHNFSISREEFEQDAADEFGNRGGRQEGMFFADNMSAVPRMKSMSNAVQLSGESKKDYVQAEVRSNFVDALYWNAHIVTDYKGEAKIKIKMPDNLTTWRATVRGVTHDTEVGQEINKVITRKDLLVRVEAPRFFREGDELFISTIIHNYLSEAKKTKISFNADNLKILGSRISGSENGGNSLKTGSGNYELIIDKNSEVRIDWKISVNHPIGEAKIFAEALTDEESDAIEVKIPILPNGIKEIQTLSSDYSGETVEDVLQFKIPSGVDIRTASFTFNTSPSIASTVLKALDELVGYPYGCVEQTMSRFLPTIIVANTFKEINAPLNTKTISELPEMSQAGLKRLYNFQHSDGGWGWWKNDNSHPYMTAYVIYGMTIAANAGFDVDENIYKKGIENLVSQIENFGSGDPTTLAYMIYSISSVKVIDNKKKDLIGEKIFKLQREDLNSYTLSLLIIAALNSNDKSTAEKIAENLKEQVEEDKNSAKWGGEAWHYRWQNDNVQSTAYAVKALLMTEGESPLVTKAVRWLMQQKQGFAWRSTQETAIVVFAITDYLKVTDELNPDYNIEVFVNGKKSFEEKYTNRDVFKNSPVIRIKDNLRNGDNEIRIIKRGPGKLYFSGQNQYYTKNEVAAAKVKKFEIKREYFLLQPEESSGRIIYLKKKFDGTLKSGEQLLVKTHVEANENQMQYFILEDMLPSGFEVVKDEQNYEIEGESNYQPYDYYRAWYWFYADKEYRDEKVSFFVTNTNPSMEFSYIIRAQIPGEYEIMPAQGCLMYYPEVSGYSKFVSVKVEE